jgi:hypothetical protein
VSAQLAREKGYASNSLAPKIRLPRTIKLPWPTAINSEDKHAAVADDYIKLPRMHH